MPKYVRFISVAILVLVLTACNLPSEGTETESPDAVMTAAAQTVSANLTQRAAAAQPTEPPPPAQPTSTTAAPPVITLAVPTTNVLPAATATLDCDKATFVTDVTIPDGTTFAPGESFTKTWRLKNAGTCSWTPSYSIVFDSGDAMGGPSSQALAGNVNPGETVDVSVNLKAPATAGSYKGYWKMKNASGVLFSTSGFYVDIKVADSGGGGFAVTSVKKLDAFYISGHGMSFTAEITVNKAGTVQYHWIVRESGQPDLETAVATLTFTNAGAEDAALLWTGCPHSGSFTGSVYIDDPNHQEFGSVDFNCP